MVQEFLSRKGKYKAGDIFPNNKRLIKRIGSHPKFRTAIWMWECTICNTEHGPSMTSSITRADKFPSCCAKTKTGSNNPKWSGFKEISGTYLNSIRGGAKRRGLDFFVTPEELWAIWLVQEGKCAYTGWPLKHGIDSSVDRIKNELGYVVGNVQWVHKDINKMKTDLPEEYFIKLCEAVAANDSSRINRAASRN